MVLGAQTTALAGTVLLLRSPDLLSWSVVGPILAPGAHGYMCECPDLFRIGDSDVLIFCEQHHEGGDGGSGLSANVAGAVIGRIDLANGNAAYAFGTVSGSPVGMMVANDGALLVLKQGGITRFSAP